MININITIFRALAFFSVLYPVVGSFTSLSIAAGLPIFFATIFFIFKVLQNKFYLPYFSLYLVFLIIICLSSTILNSDLRFALAAYKNFASVPIFYLLFYSLFRKIKNHDFLRLINNFFKICLIINIFSLFELLSRLINPFTSYTGAYKGFFHNYFVFTNATAILNTGIGEVSGIFGGGNTLGFYGDIHSSAGLCTITLLYFLITKQYKLSWLSFFCVVSIISFTAFMTAISTSLILLFRGKKLVDLIRIPLFFIGSITFMNIIFPGRLVSKLTGSSFDIIRSHVLDGLDSLNIKDLFFGNGYSGGEGATLFKESAFVEYIYSVGILSHLIIFLILILVIYFPSTSYKSKINSFSINGIKRIKKIKFSFNSKSNILLGLIIFYLGSVIHYNNFYNPPVMFAFSILLLTIHKIDFKKKENEDHFLKFDY